MKTIDYYQIKVEGNERLKNFYLKEDKFEKYEDARMAVEKGLANFLSHFQQEIIHKFMNEDKIGVGTVYFHQVVCKMITGFAYIITITITKRNLKLR